MLVTTSLVDLMHSVALILIIVVGGVVSTLMTNLGIRVVGCWN